MKGGKAVQGNDEIGLSELSVFFESFVEGIMARGKSKLGDKTVVDSIYPAVNALRKSAENGNSLKEGLVAAHEAAVQGLEDTKNMIAQHGRAAYYGEGSLGKQDAGATVGMLIIQGFLEACNNN